MHSKFQAWDCRVGLSGSTALDDPRREALNLATAGLSHDMANLIMPIRARLHHLENLALSAEACQDIEAIEACVNYLASLTESVRMLTGTGSLTLGGPPSTHLGTWWQHSEKLLRSVLPPQVELACDLVSCDLRVRISPTQLTHAVLNLVHNAGKALNQRTDGRLRIWATRSLSGVTLAVSDNGPGLPPALTTTTASGFATTPEAAHGLGLCLVQEIVEHAGGTVHCQSSRDTGCTFLLTLPEYDDACATDSTPPDRLSGCSGVR